jgi:hypothetical protein
MSLRQGLNLGWDKLGQDQFKVGQAGAMINQSRASWGNDNSTGGKLVQ